MKILIILRNGDHHELESDGADINTDMRMYCDFIGARFPLDLQVVEVLPEEEPPIRDIEPLGGPQEKEAPAQTQKKKEGKGKKNIEKENA